MHNVTVRGFIWSWQLVELLVITYWLANSGTGLLKAGASAILIMIGLRFLVIGFVAAYVVFRPGSQDRAFTYFLSSWLGEAFAFCRLYFWYQALPRRWVTPNVRRIGQKHVILVHGFLCNDGFWYALRPKIEAQGYTVTTVEQPKAFASIEYFSALIQQEVERLDSNGRDIQISVIAFSMGGLAARHLPAAVQKRIQLITVCTPHWGTALAELPGELFAGNGAQMTPKNPWILGLNSRPIQFQSGFGFWSVHDSIVVPPELSIPPFDSAPVFGMGHLQASGHKALHERLIQKLP